MSALDFLNQRRSVPALKLVAPGPTPAQLDALFAAALRVPDHGKLAPWRLLVIDGDERGKLAARLAALAERAHPERLAAKRAKDRERLEQVPLIIAVIATIDANHPKVPAQEQLLSAGCLGYNLLLGAQALGFGAQWLTGWAAYDREAADILGLAANERVVSFVYIGTPTLAAPERERPRVADKVSRWTA